MAKNFKPQAPNALIDVPVTPPAPTEPFGTATGELPGGSFESDNVVNPSAATGPAVTTVAPKAPPATEEPRLTGRVSYANKTKLDAYCYYFRCSQRDALAQALELLFERAGDSKMRDAVQVYENGPLRKTSKPRS